MAYKIGAVGGFVIHQDNPDTENNPVASKKAKAADPPATKRVALGLLSNTSNLRVQPFRSAKQNGNGSDSALPFTIKQDEPFASKISETVETENYKYKVDEPPSSVTRNIENLDIKENISITEDEFDEELDEKAGHENLSFDFDDKSPMGGSDSESASDGSPMHLDASMDIRAAADRTPIFTKEIIKCAEYKDDVLQHLLSSEMRLHPKAGFMDKQPDITFPMRSILIDWLIEVGEEYKLNRQTLCISVSFIDRFLAQMSVLRGKLQLVGAAATFVAAKYEEIYPPEIQEFVFITDDTYTKKQLLKMEQLILKVLSFDLTSPTANGFMEIFLSAIGEDEEDLLYNLSMFLMEFSLVYNESLCPYPPSKVAAAAIYVAGVTLGYEPWPLKLREISGYQMEDFRGAIEAMHSLYLLAPTQPQQAVPEKYKQLKFKSVSIISPPPSVF